MANTSLCCLVTICVLAVLIIGGYAQGYHDVDSGHKESAPSGRNLPTRAYKSAKNPEYYNPAQWDLYDPRQTPQWSTILQQYLNIAKNAKPKDERHDEDQDPSSPPIALGFSQLLHASHFLYFVPLGSQGQLRHGIHLRYDLSQDFHEPGSWAMFDTHLAFAHRLSPPQASYKFKQSPLFTGSLGAAVSGDYIYYAPLESTGKTIHVLRYDMRQEFTEEFSWSYNTLERVGGLDTRGYSDVVAIGQFVYFVPHTRGGSFEDYHGVVLRYDTNLPFDSTGSWTAYDVANLGSSERNDKNVGFLGGLEHDGYLYLVPSRGLLHASSKMVRYNSRAEFNRAASWEVFDAKKTNGLDTSGYRYAHAHQGFIYFAPYCEGSNFHGRVLRYNTALPFTEPKAWEAFDAGYVDSHITVGYSGVVSHGPYVYFVPHDNLSFHGQFLRYDSRKPFRDRDSWRSSDIGAIDGVLVAGLSGGVSVNESLYFAPYGFPGVPRMRFTTKILPPSSEDR